MYTFMFSIPPQMVSQELVPIPSEALEITDRESTTQLFRLTPDPLPILRCEECGALVAGDSYSQTTHNSYHDRLQWGYR